MDGPASAQPSLWGPLRSPIFRKLFIADLLSDMGTFMQAVGAAWLMVSLSGSATFVALTQTAASLPFFLFALPAGALGDIVDRRKLILYCECWMTAIALVLVVASAAGLMSPWLLLLLTFALAAGDAIEAPAYRALLPELVDKADLTAASALNGIEFNFARAVGPALAGALIAVAGVAAAFLVNVLSFAGVIVVVARWKRHVRQRLTPPETVAGASVAALRYVRYSPEIRSVILRAAVTTCAASAMLALLPSLARSVSDRPIVYGLLLGSFGAGAVVGALALQPARSRWSVETISSAAVAILGAMIALAGSLRDVWLLAIVLLVAGAGWLIFISLITALAQILVPDWARARVLAVFILCIQGALAAGSAMWGLLAARIGLAAAFVAAGTITVAAVAMRAFGNLPDGAADTTPWDHWRMPDIIHEAAPALERGGVLISVRYHVRPQHDRDFLRAMADYGRVRRRDGASWWGVFRDLERADVFIEAFFVTSWAEHLRQHARFTRGDEKVERRLLLHIEGEPVVEHFVGAEAAPPYRVARDRDASLTAWTISPRS